MKRINVRQAIDAIASKEEFNAGNLWGRWDSYPAEDGERYIVYSYRQWIAIFNKTSNEWELNTNKYSVTTSKHQNFTRRAIGVGANA